MSRVLALRSCGDQVHYQERTERKRPKLQGAMGRALARPHASAWRVRGARQKGWHVGPSPVFAGANGRTPASAGAAERHGYAEGLISLNGQCRGQTSPSIMPGPARSCVTLGKSGWVAPTHTGSCSRRSLLLSHSQCGEHEACHLRCRQCVWKAPRQRLLRRRTREREPVLHLSCQFGRARRLRCLRSRPSLTSRVRYRSILLVQQVPSG